MQDSRKGRLSTGRDLGSRSAFPATVSFEPGLQRVGYNLIVFVVQVRVQAQCSSDVRVSHRHLEPLEASTGIVPQ